MKSNEKRFKIWEKSWDRWLENGKRSSWKSEYWALVYLNKHCVYDHSKHLDDYEIVEFDVSITEKKRKSASEVMIKSRKKLKKKVTSGLQAA